MKVVYINASFSGNIHEIIDSSLLGMLSSRHDVYSYAQKSRTPYLRNTVNSVFKGNRISWSDLKDGNIKGIINALTACFREVKVILRYKKENPIFFISFVNGISANIINLICMLAKVKVIFIAHNDLECVNRHVHNSRGFKSYLLYLFYTKIPLAKSLKIMVLGDNILQNLSFFLKNARIKHFFSFDHPYFSIAPNNTLSNIQKEHSFVDIGLVGRMDSRPSRGLINLCEFANKVYADKTIRIHIISSIDKTLIDQLPKNIIVRDKPESILSREEYENRLAKMDYYLIPYHQDYYKLTASGAVFEGIVNSKPVLMFSTDYFCYISDKYGRFGIFVDVIKSDQLIEMLHDSNLYNSFVQEEKKISKSINPMEMANSFNRIVEKLWD